MKNEELQAAGDAAWLILGPDNFGVAITNHEDLDMITIEVVGFDNGQMQLFTSAFTATSVERLPGDPRYNYFRKIIECLRESVSDIRKARIAYSLGQ